MMIRPVLFLAAFAILSSFPNFLAAEEKPQRSVEDIFRHAGRYGVKVKGSVAWPLEDDDRGGWTGAGFLVNKKRGWILTNAHVSSRSPAKLRVKFKDSDYINAKQVFVDTRQDLAVLEIDPASVPGYSWEAKLDCAANYVQGIAVGAYGHPLGLDFSATRGIISGKRFDDGSDALPDREVIQTDAPINGGNSGGPLINLQTGEVVGVNSASVRNSDGLHFAEPIEYACKILKLLEEGKDPSAPKLGVIFLDNKQDENLVVAQVRDDAWDEFMAGDILISVNGSDKLKNSTQLIHHLRGKTGEAVFKVKRGDATKDIKINIVFEKKITDKNAIIAGGMMISKEWFQRDRRFVRDQELMIDYIESSSNADFEGVKTGDRIWLVNGKEILTLDSLWKEINQSKENKITLVVRRMGVARDVASSYYSYTIDLDEPARKLRPELGF